MTCRRDRHRERGQATVELVALVPLVALAMVLVVDLIGVVWAANAAGQAAYDGARARSLDLNYTSAVEDSLPGSITTWSASPVAEHGVRVTVRAPGTGLIGRPTVSREVVLP